MSSHKQGLAEGFTKRYGVKMLVWFQEFAAMEDAIRREKQLKEWRRAWKIELIEKLNPTWLDLLAKFAG